MKTFVSLLALLLVSLCTCPQLATAHSNGAGQCVSGTASVSSTHLTNNVITGTLSDGGFSMRVRSLELRDKSLATIGSMRFDSEFAVIAGNRPFKGVLIVAKDVYDTDANIDLDPVGNDLLQAAANCPEQVAVTHIDASPKSAVVVTVSADKEVLAHVDVTVVVENSNGVSEYYYSSLQMQILSHSLNDFFDFCVEQLAAADDDNNFVLDHTEYFNFISLLGEDAKCYAPRADGSLTDEQKATFESMACTICMGNGQEPADCCISPTELPIAGVNKPSSSMTTLEYRHLSSICQFAYSKIPPSC